MPPTVTVHGYDIDLDVLYRAMWDQAVEEGGVRVFKGNSRDVRSVKRLLNDLFNVPVQDRKDPRQRRGAPPGDPRAAPTGLGKEGQRPQRARGRRAGVALRPVPAAPCAVGPASGASTAAAGSRAPDVRGSQRVTASIARPLAGGPS